ncbi:MAG: CopG family transcriptional regulator [Ruminococcus sp.]|nr:CopG family transcriptional regulator [Ruminococcus sp.]
MKEEIVIPHQYVAIIMTEAAKRGLSADEIVETVIRKFLERSKADAE